MTTPTARAFDMALAAQIAAYHPDLLVLAGYMRILSPPFVQRFTGRILNVHPSLLPRYPGLETHRRALENGDAQHGASVHFVSDKLDGGPVVLQAVVPIFADDSVAGIAARVQVQEHAIYPLAVAQFCSDRLRQRDGLASAGWAGTAATGIRQRLGAAYQTSPPAVIHKQRL